MSKQFRRISVFLNKKGDNLVFGQANKGNNSQNNNNNAQNNAAKPNQNNEILGKEGQNNAQNQQTQAQNQQNQEQTQPKPRVLTNEEKIKELTEALQRLQAEFENYQKRSTKQNVEFQSFANAKLIEELLPVLDSLEAGMQHDKELVRVYEQLLAVLKKKGLAKINVKTGEKFNHDTMECMLQEKNPQLKEDVVASVLITGYFLNGKILRATKVSVSFLGKHDEKEKNETENQKAVENSNTAKGETK